MPEEALQRALWEVRKVGVNIMMSLEGGGRPISFIKDCAAQLDSLVENTGALTDVFPKYGGRVPRLDPHAARAADARHAMRRLSGGAAKMRAIAEEASLLVGKFKDAFSGEQGDRLCRRQWIEWQFSPAINRAFRLIRHELDPINVLNPDHRPAAHGRRQPASLRAAGRTA